VATVTAQLSEAKKRAEEEGEQVSQLEEIKKKLLKVIYNFFIT
jgi:hypothetical protein